MLKVVSQESFFSGPAPEPTPDQLHLCQYTPWRDLACLIRLCELHHPKRFLEVGCHRGATLRILMDRFTEMECTGVDPGDDVPPIERNPVQRGEHIQKMRVGELAPRASIYRQRFANVWPPCNFDGIFVDGDHRRNALLHDHEKALKLLAPGGFIAYHDVGNFRVPDVQAVLEELPIEVTWVEGTWFAFHRVML